MLAFTLCRGLGFGTCFTASTRLSHSRRTARLTTRAFLCETAPTKGGLGPTALLWPHRSQTPRRNAPSWTVLVSLTKKLVHGITLASASTEQTTGCSATTRGRHPLQPALLFQTHTIQYVRLLVQLVAHAAATIKGAKITANMQQTSKPMLLNFTSGGVRRSALASDLLLAWRPL